MIDSCLLDSYHRHILTHTHVYTYIRTRADIIYESLVVISFQDIVGIYTKDCLALSTLLTVYLTVLFLPVPTWLGGPVVRTLECRKSCKAPVKSSPPTNQHPVLFTGQMPCCFTLTNINNVRSLWCVMLLMVNGVLLDRLAHTALGAHSEAKICYQRALELDPINETYRENLRQCEQLNRDENVSRY